ncbi:actin-related protein 5 [Nematocida ausubeli]|nr:actin-related protein 5 [Nematocida ausubeli]
MGSLLVIDNGTYECKAGMKEEIPSLRFRNQIYRLKGKDGRISYSISAVKKQNTTLTLKSMFDGPVIYNYDVLEGTIQSIIKEIKGSLNGKGKEEIDELVITECFLNPQVFKDLAMESIFNAFSFKKVSFGYDFMYAYEYNLRNNPGMSLQKDGFNREFCDVVISMGHLGVYVVPLDPMKEMILSEESTYMPLGSLAAQHIFHRSIANKYCGSGIKVQREEVSEHFKAIRVPLDYMEEIEEVVYKGTGNLQILQKTGKEKASVPRVFPKRKPSTEDSRKKAKHQEENKDTHKEDAEIGELEPEKEELEIEAEEVIALLEKAEATKPEITTEEEQAKRLKREKLIRGATDHRNKQKVIKSLERLNHHIFLLEDRHLLINNPSEFIKLRRNRLEYLERIIKKRTFVRNELKNKKSPHSLALLKKSLEQIDAPQEDNIYLQEIRSASLEDIEILEEIEHLDAFLRENDPEYVEKEENPLDKIRHGYKEKGGININVEFIRTGEALFNPAIVGIEQPGITESLSLIMQTKDVRNVFITGGFSQIKGIKERIQKELVPLRYLPNDPSVVCALDPVIDAYKGAFIKSPYAQTLTREDYTKLQTEKTQNEDSSEK